MGTWVYLVTETLVRETLVEATSQDEALEKVACLNNFSGDDWQVLETDVRIYDAR